MLSACYILEEHYYTVEEMIAMIDEPNRSMCTHILTENRKLFQTVQGSTNNHQAWSGGYFDHVQEIMNIAIILYERLNIARPLPFSLSDALLVVFLHDIEKPWKYELSSDGQLQEKKELKTKAAQHEFRARKLEEYGIVLTEDQKNGMKYVEGEFNDYSNRRRMMNPLAALCHLADVTSARIWFDHPRQEKDPWLGAQRIRK
ncbi:MAG: hypothetical protein HZA35_03590 [Parcubacteria group bacterium]|nr:hypothetical protein [Parcubacteria group bacterium]